MEREARRNKIKSRETDRMALITGRIQVLDPNVAKSSSFSDNRSDHSPLLSTHSRSASEPALENDVELFPDHPRGGDDHNDDDDDDGTASRHGKDDDFSSDHENATKISQKDASLPPFRLTRVSSELVVSSASGKAKLPRKPLEYHLSSITPKDINYSVISTENTRAICSLVIAFLVVLSQIGLPHKVIKSKSLIAYRPLYAVLLSDVLVVAATLALLSHGKEGEREREVKLEKDVNWDGAVKVLEWGLILHQTVRALFIDCSLYLAIVISGLSLMH